MKRSISLLLSFVMLLGVFGGFSVNAYALENSWTSGSTTVKYNENTGVLTVSGSGAMADYTSASAPAWTDNYKFDRLTKVVIENGVTSIGNWAFSNMYSLESVQIPDTVKNIGERAFSGSKSIVRINIPASVASIGNAAFRTASESIKSNLEAIYVDSANAYYSSENGVLYDKDKTVLIQIPSSIKESKLVIPSTVTSIMQQSGVSCSEITEITVPESVSVIGAKAFARCDNLKDIYFYSKTDLTIGASVVTEGSAVTFHGYTNSPAHLYAKNNSLNFDNFPVVIFKSADEKIVMAEYAPGTKAADIAVAKQSQTVSNSDGTHSVYKWSPEISDVTDDVTYTEVSESFECSYEEGEILSPATVDKNGEIAARCKICGYKNMTGVIYAPSDMKLGRTAYEYTGKDIGPGVTVKDSAGNTLKYKTDYSLVYDAGRTNAGRYGVTIHFMGKYAGSETLYFDITPKPAEKCTAKLSKTEYEYTGKDIGPGVSVVDDTGRKLVYKTDYTLTYDNGRVLPGTYSVTVNYIGNYAGSQTLWFTIKKSHSLTAKLSSTSYVYTGRDIGPGVSVKDEKGNTLKYKTDYTLTYAAGRTDAGRYGVTVNYIGQYAGIPSETLYFDIVPKSSAKCTVKLSKTEYAYTGKDIGPGVSIVDDTGRKLIYKTDYTLTYAPGRTEPGEYYIDVNYIGNYSGSVRVYFIIKEPVTLIAKLSAQTYYYTGKDIGPGVTVKTSDGETLKYKTDYMLVYDEGRTEVGTYSVIVNYIGAYAGVPSETLYFDIVDKPASQFTVKPSAWSYYYTGKDIGPGITVTDSSGRKLVYKTDYTLTYDEGRTKVGRYSITVNYIGNYSGSQTIYFYIIPKQVSIKSLTKNLLDQSFTVDWYTQKEEITGYNVQYSQHSDFSGGVTLTFDNPSASSVTRTKMGKNKTYYVRVRTYKNVVVDGRQTTLFSGWSAVKSVVVDECLSLNRSAYQISRSSNNVSYTRFGTSVQGRPLEAYIITNGSKYTKTFVMDFAIHGFEDNYYRDGQVLVEEANKLIEYYSKNPSKLKNMRLVIIPCLNPDGTIAGLNNQRANPNAFGRCNANHVDMNRDFGSGLFKASETRSYVNFLNNYQPDVYLNFHGWDNESIGSPDLCNIITPALGLNGRKPDRFGADSGYVIGYVHNTYNCPSAIVEFASPYRVDHGNVCNMLNRIIDNYNR